MARFSILLGLLSTISHSIVGTTFAILFTDDSLTNATLNPLAILQAVGKTVAQDIFNSLRGDQMSVINLDPSRTSCHVHRPRHFMEFVSNNEQLAAVEFGGAQIMKVGDGDRIQICEKISKVEGPDDVPLLEVKNCDCDYKVRTGDIYVYKGGCNFLTLNGYDWNAHGMDRQFCSGFGELDRPACMMRLTCAMSELYWADMLSRVSVKGSYQVTKGRAMCDSDWSQAEGSSDLIWLPRPGLWHAKMDCWTGCKYRQGRCDWCGAGGRCCRHPGFHLDDTFSTEPIRKEWTEDGCGLGGCTSKHCCILA